MLVLSAKHFAKTSLPTSIFTERFSLLTTNLVTFRFKFWDKLAFKGKFSANLTHWITSSWPYAETGSRSPHTTKVIEIIQSASCLKNQLQAGSCMLREINRLKFYFAALAFLVRSCLQLYLSNWQRIQHFGSETDLAVIAKQSVFLTMTHLQSGLSLIHIWRCRRRG